MQIKKYTFARDTLYYKKNTVYNWRKKMETNRDLSWECERRTKDRRTEGRITFLDSDQFGDTSLVITSDECSDTSIDYSWDLTTKRNTSKKASRNIHKNQSDTATWNQSGMRAGYSDTKELGGEDWERNIEKWYPQRICNVRY